MVSNMAGCNKVENMMTSCSVLSEYIFPYLKRKFNAVLGDKCATSGIDKGR